MTTDRRQFLTHFAGLGLSTTLFPGVLWGHLASGAELNDGTIVAAAEVAGVSFNGDERKQMLEGLKRQVAQIDALHKVALENAIAPAMVFNPLPTPDALPREVQRPLRRAPVSAPAVPGNLEDLCYEPLTVLAELVRRRKVSSTALTKMYLARLERLDASLHCVVTLTPDRALAQAKAADEEIARGKYRGALHGIPWGAKDLLAVKGYPTTWGTAPFKEQRFDEDATVVQRLDVAGAVLLAKLTLGELAQGDTWFGGQTRNPWKLDQGSSGSSAGPGSATAAGCVGFSIGTETLGSISSPATRNGVTGLRPTFGRVPRTGAMALSWSMDKIGPMCRAVEDCALVFAAMHGSDGRDLSVHDAAFNWDAALPLKGLRVGYIKSAFDLPTAQNATKPFDDEALDVMRTLGVQLVPVEIPDLPYGAMRMVLSAEAAAAFDQFTRDGLARQMAQQGPGAWPNTFRTAHLIPATEYVNAMRVRTIAIHRWADLMKSVDVIVTPTGAGSQLVATNLTGHPALILPNGFRDDGTPVSLTFLGRLFGEAKLLRVALAYQQATPHHRRHPSL